MASFKQALICIDSLPINSVNFYGIKREFFPKWEGWKIIDAGKIPDKNTVAEFYNMYFWSKLKGDLIHNQELAELLFLFSILNGKKKTIEKLSRVLARDILLVNNEVINEINSADVIKLFMYLYCEISEFCIMLDKKQDFYKLLRIYNKFISNNL